MNDQQVDAQLEALLDKVRGEQKKLDQLSDPVSRPKQEIVIEPSTELAPLEKSSTLPAEQEESTSLSNVFLGHTPGEKLRVGLAFTGGMMVMHFIHGFVVPLALTAGVGYGAYKYLRWKASTKEEIVDTDATIS